MGPPGKRRPLTPARSHICIDRHGYKRSAVFSGLRIPAALNGPQPPPPSSSGSSGFCRGSRRAFCGNGLFVPQQCVHFMSQQATAGSLCRAKHCLIGFRSMATPPEACVCALCQQHLECGGGDYIPPGASQASGNTPPTVTVSAARLSRRLNTGPPPPPPMFFVTALQRHQINYQSRFQTTENAPPTQSRGKLNAVLEDFAVSRYLYFQPVRRGGRKERRL